MVATTYKLASRDATKLCRVFKRATMTDMDVNQRATMLNSPKTIAQ